MSKKLTAVEWLIDELKEIGIRYLDLAEEQIEQALRLEREQMVDLVQSLKDYTNESHAILGHDEREASEFVDIYYTQTYGKCTPQS